jgi:hypothetical protein
MSRRPPISRVRRSLLRGGLGGADGSAAAGALRKGCEPDIEFPATHWSVVLEAKGQSAAAQEALEKICLTYWRPVYSFTRRQGAAPEEAEDLTQSFFALLLERRDFDAVRRDKGRLRSYPLTSLKHFLASEHRRAIGSCLSQRSRSSARASAEENPAGCDGGMFEATCFGFLKVAQ